MRAKADLILGDTQVPLYHEPQETRFLMLIFRKPWGRARVWGEGFRVRGSALLFGGLVFALYWWSGNAGVGDISRFESCRNWANLKQQAGFQKYPLYFRNLYKKKGKESIIVLPFGVTIINVELR